MNIIKKLKLLCTILSNGKKKKYLPFYLKFLETSGTKKYEYF